MMKLQKDGASALGILAPWLFFWGVVLLGMATADFISQWTSIGWMRHMLGWAAAAVTAAGFLAGWLRRGGFAGTTGLLEQIVLPVAVLLGSVLLLDYIHAVDAFFAPMFRALLLAVWLVYAGAGEARGLLYLGLWLFAGAWVLGIWYLGYAPLVLEGMSGLALIAAGGLLLRQRNGKEREE